MSTDIMNIAAFKGLKPAQAFAILDPHSESLADGIGSSYGILGYKGKVWSLRLRGEVYNFLRPDDGSPLAFLDVIILRQLPNKSKSFYPPGSYVDGQVGQRPICAALDGVTPDADIATPQSPACATCDRNVFKTSPDGRKSRDCSDYKRLAVLVLPSLTKGLLGAALMEPVFLRVPAASLNDLALLGEGMQAQGFHFSSYITRIGFHPDKPHPQMIFRALQPLADREAALVLPLREDATARRITGESDVGHKAKPLAQVTGPTAAEISAQALNAEKAASEKAAAAKVMADKAAADKAAASQMIDTGFGDMDQSAGAADMGLATTTQLAQQTVGVAQNTDDDVGAPEESDTDLDNRIAGILGS